MTLQDGGSPWPSAACQAQTTMILSKMTRQEKAAQMVMADDPKPGDITGTGYGAAFLGGGENPGGITVSAWAPEIDAVLSSVPPVSGMPSVKIPLLYGFDAVHGNSGTQGTVVFPHNAGMASSRDAAFVTQVGQIEAQEILAAGVNWMFGPFAGTTWDYRWGRTYESFSEDPTWAGEMIAALILGLQGPTGLGSSNHLMACSKHAAGDGQCGPPSNRGGVVDRGNAVITDAQMEQWGLAQYVPAMAAGLGCIMVSDGFWNGQYMTTDAHLILDLVKGMYGFKGFVISDYNSACGTATVPAALAGVDMFMAPECQQAAITALATATAPGLPARIDDAVTRILNAKCQAGDFAVPSFQPDPSLIAAAGGPAHRKVGEQAVAQSLVLLQNNGKVLPISKTANVYVGGSGSNDIGRQCGGWTISWQGSSGSITTGTTILQGITNVKPPVATMADADVVVIVLSELISNSFVKNASTYAEFEGDVESIDTLNPADISLLAQARMSGKPVVAIIISGRPVLINSPAHPTTLANADAWIAAWLPGTEGEGVADVLFGDYPPTGKLSHSWPPDDTSANIMCGTAPGGYAQKNCIAEGGYKPLFALGYGCSGYTCP
jgi:beta-glucosidase